MATRSLPPGRRRAVRRADEQETRQRVLEAAAQLFSERGFERVSVRDICRKAGANVAAVNYHFRDKAHLYSEVMSLAVSIIRRAHDEALAAPRGSSPRQKLAHFVRTFLRGAVLHWDDSWIQRLLSREIADPSPAFRMVAEQIVEPRVAYLSRVVSELLGCPAQDARVERCLASLHGQWLVYAPGRFRGKLVPHWKPTPESVDALAQHIVAFSLAGIRAIARQRRRSAS